MAVVSILVVGGGGKGGRGNYPLSRTFILRILLRLTSFVHCSAAPRPFKLLRQVLQLCIRVVVGITRSAEYPSSLSLMLFFAFRHQLIPQPCGVRDCICGSMFQALKLIDASWHLYLVLTVLRP